MGTSVDLALAFETSGAPDTKAALTRLVYLRRRLNAKQFADVYECVTLYCGFAEACTRAPETKTNIELRFFHGKDACNCVWFPVIRHGLDLAYLFLQQTTGKFL